MGYGEGPSLLMGGYDHSLPPRETGDSGALRPFMICVLCAARRGSLAVSGGRQAVVVGGLAPGRRTGWRRAVGGGMAGGRTAGGAGRWEVCGSRLVVLGGGRRCRGEARPHAANKGGTTLCQKNRPGRSCGRRTVVVEGCHNMKRLSALGQRTGRQGEGRPILVASEVLSSAGGCVRAQVARPCLASREQHRMEYGYSVLRYSVRRKMGSMGRGSRVVGRCGWGTVRPSSWSRSSRTWGRGTRRDGGGTERSTK